MDLARPTFRGELNLDVASGGGFVAIPDTGIRVPAVGSFILFATLTYSSYAPSDPSQQNAQGRHLYHAAVVDGSGFTIASDTYGVTAGTSPLIAAWVGGVPTNPPNSWGNVIAAINLNNALAANQFICIDWSATICDTADAVVPTLVSGG